MRKYSNIICLLLFSICGAGLYAQTVRSNLESATAYMGQSVGYTIQISGSEKIDRPELENFRGFKVEEAGESASTRTTIINGKRDQVVVSEYAWRLIPLQTGTIAIPPVRITVDGEELQTTPGSLRVIKPAAIEGYQLFLTVEENNLFPGLPSRLTLKWLISSQVSQPEFSLSFLDNPDLKVVNLPPPSGKSNDIFQFSIGGETVYATQSAEVYEGQQYATLNMGWDIYPSREGTIELDPVLLSFKRGTGRDGWGSVQYENTVIPSNPLTLEVHPLSAELKDSPGGLLIAKDALNVSLELDQSRVYPGDPVTVKILFENLLQPDLTEFKGLTDFPELKDRFRIDNDSLISSVNEDKLQIKQTVRVTDDKAGSFPSLEFTYYNQAEGKVEHVSTEAMDLEIIPITAGIGPLKTTDREEGISSAERELLSLRYNEDLSRIRNFSIRQIPLWVFLLCPPLLYLLVFIVKNLLEGDFHHLLSSLLRKEDPLIILKKRTAALNRNRSDENIRDFNSFIRTWLSEYYKIDPLNSTEEMAESLSAQLKEEKAEGIIQILEKLDHYCWSGLDFPDDYEFPKLTADRFYEKSRRKSS